MNQNMLTDVNEIDNFVECERHSKGIVVKQKKKIYFLIIKETDHYIVTRGLSDLSNLDS